MYDSLSVAKTLSEMYEKRFHKEMTEMQMHKLMYFAQRESLLVNETVLFDEPFYGWKYGPVLRSVRQEYKKEHRFEFVDDVKDPDVVNLLDQVLTRYGGMTAWNLSELSHNELSWKFARFGMKPNDNGDVQLSLDLMRTDAKREKAARGKGRAWT